MNYFDLHCDTATVLFDRGEKLKNSGCQISLKDISEFSSYSQVFAIFSKPGVSDDDCYKRFFEVLDSFVSANGISFSKTGNNDLSYILSVEDARLLHGRIEKLDTLFDFGVRIMTPLWSGVTCIGGSFDTDEGLTEFGREVIRRCLTKGIIPDISHASVRSADEIFEIAASFSSPVLATHSNSYEICSHPRNLREAQVQKLKKSKGIVGICLHSPHLGEEADIETVIKHIDYYSEHIGIEAVALGCDLDGTDNLPKGISCLSDVKKIADGMSAHGYSDDDINRVFYKNAHEFFKKNLGVPRKETK